MSKDARAARAAAELAAYCASGPPPLPAFDAEEEASEAVAAIWGGAADVVLTTYAVLQQEVHLSPRHADGVAARALRHAKRYRVPESPLLQVGGGFLPFALPRTPACFALPRSLLWPRHCKKRHWLRFAWFASSLTCSAVPCTVRISLSCHS
jgi:hypothetical protein